MQVVEASPILKRQYFLEKLLTNAQNFIVIHTENIKMFYIQTL